MKYILALASGFLSFGNLASAGCYSGGDAWPNTEEARSYVDFACRGNGGMFTGFYDAHQTKSMCPNSGPLGLLFEVQNLNDQEGFDLGDDDCYFRLTNLIFGCGNGGEDVISGWRFRADPGNC